MSDITIYVPEQNPQLDGTNSASINIQVKYPVVQPTVRYPTGKGILIWNLNGDYLNTVSKLVGLGVKWVAPKVVNAVNPYNGMWIIAFIKECRKAGIDVWGWGYTYGVNPTQEGLATSTIINNLDISGYFIDAEGEYDQVNMSGQAQAYMNNLVHNTHKPLGLCSYRYPNLHNNFPWNDFLAGVDFHIPQVYWIQAIGDTMGGYNLGKSYVQLQAKKALPFIPVGTIVKDDYSTWVPTPAQVTGFYNTAKQLNLPGFSYYDLDSALPNLLDVVKAQV